MTNSSHHFARPVAPMPTVAKRLPDLAVRESAAKPSSAHVPVSDCIDVNMNLAIDRWQDDGGQG
jgi:hypothetical protein